MIFHKREAKLDVATNVHKAFGSCTSLHLNARRHSKSPSFCNLSPDLSLEVVNHTLSLDVMVRVEKWVHRHSSLCTTHPDRPVDQVAQDDTQ